eukprot:scaffold10571_cov154-Cylindrotheca_fusiformis.AAC.8
MMYRQTGYAIYHAKKDSRSCEENVSIFYLAAEIYTLKVGEKIQPSRLYRGYCKLLAPVLERHSRATVRKGIIPPDQTFGIHLSCKPTTSSCFVHYNISSPRLKKVNRMGLHS